MRAKIIADSINECGDRLTTMEVKMHRFVLAEFNTHRVFSRNSASSRAIPVAKQLKAVRQDPAIPVVWAAEQKGMQGGDEIGDTETAERLWRQSASYAADTAERLSDLGVHKSVTNRILEPFMWHTVIVSSTEWENFFAQRCSPLAQPEIRVVAEDMRTALQQSQPVELSWGDWHTPYIQEDEEDMAMHQQIKLSAARCARVSYLTHDGQRSHDADYQLFERLVSASPPHWSPLEHVATPIGVEDLRPVGNFYGWNQLRHSFQNYD